MAQSCTEKKYGEDKIVKHPFCDYPWYLEGLVRPKISNEEAVEQTPLNKQGKEQLLRVLTSDLGVLDLSKKELQSYISTHSYFDFLKTILDI